MALILRLTKGSKLTWSELDGNFTYLLSLIESVPDGSNYLTIEGDQELTPAQQGSVLINIGALPVGDFTPVRDRVDTLWETGFITYDPQSLTPIQRETVHANLDIYSRAQVDDLISGATPRSKTKDLYTHTILETDIVGGDVKFNLPHTPDQRDWYDLHINTSWVKPGSYEILNGYQLAIYGDRLPYSLKPGAEVIFQYTYTDV